MTEETDEIPDSGCIISFGKICSDDLSGKLWIKNDSITKVSCGDEFTILLTESGRLFSFGKNDWGQLGIGSTSAVSTPTLIKYFKSINESVSDVACGRNHVIVNTVSDKCYGFGSNSDGQLGLDTSSEKVDEPIEMDQLTEVNQISAGGDFSAAIDRNGKLWVWGSNSEYQLGQGYNFDDDHSWKVLSVASLFKQSGTSDGQRRRTRSRSRVKAKSVSCGTYHMGVILTDGSLWMWGEGGNGQLGTGDTEDRTEPVRIHIKDGGATNISQVSCGLNHTICLTNDGEVFVWGSGDVGQLGLGPRCVMVDQPKQLKFPSNLVDYYSSFSSNFERITKVCAGSSFSYLLNADGYAISFGDGRHGKLGSLSGNYSNQMWPLPVQNIQTSAFVVDVDCGGCLAVLLLRPRKSGDVALIQSKMDSIEVMDSRELLNRMNQPNSTGRQRSRRKRSPDEFGSAILPNLRPDSDSDQETTTHKKAQVDEQQQQQVEVEEEILVKYRNTVFKEPENISTKMEERHSVGEEIKFEQKLNKNPVLRETESTPLILEERNSNSKSKTFDQRLNNESKQLEKIMETEAILSEDEMFNQKVDQFEKTYDSVYNPPDTANYEDPAPIPKRRQKKKRTLKAKSYLDTNNIPADGDNGKLYGDNMDSPHPMPRSKKEDYENENVKENIINGDRLDWKDEEEEKEEKERQKIKDKMGDKKEIDAGETKTPEVANVGCSNKCGSKTSDDNIKSILRKSKTDEENRLRDWNNNYHDHDDFSNEMLSPRDAQKNSSNNKKKMKRVKIVEDPSYVDDTKLNEEKVTDTSNSKSCAVL